MMTVKELKILIKEQPDNAIVNIKKGSWIIRPLEIDDLRFTLPFPKEE